MSERGIGIKVWDVDMYVVFVPQYVGDGGLLWCCSKYFGMSERGTGTKVWDVDMYVVVVAQYVGDGGVVVML
jgi:hypothetical protein